MPKITEVSSQKKNPKRFNIYLDGVFAFGADEDSVVNFRLIPGKEISQKDLDSVIFETQVGKVLEKMYSLFSVRARSEKEIRDYIKRKNFQKKMSSARAGALKENEEISEIVIERLIEVLKQKGMINDLEFARSWVESRSRKLGPNVLKMELIKKGISREIIEVMLTDRAQMSDEKQEIIARSLLEKRMERLKGLPEPEKKRKLTEFLIRRGFEYDLVRHLVEEIVKN